MSCSYTPASYHTRRSIKEEAGEDGAYLLSMPSLPYRNIRSAWNKRSRKRPRIKEVGAEPVGNEFYQGISIRTSCERSRTRGMDEADWKELFGMLAKFTINVAPITKKNHGQIIYRGNKPCYIPSKQYLQYEKDCRWFMPKIHIDTPVNVKAVFYMPTKRRVDLVNLEQALLDVMVKYGVLEDDNFNIVHSMDGSYVDYDRDRPRTEVYIWEVQR
jgi:Holliday junction resolvase RusA-like endonuclease